MNEDRLIEILKKLYFRIGILEWYGKVSDEKKLIMQLNLGKSYQLIHLKLKKIFI